jgi:hypothetical protein
METSDTNASQKVGARFTPAEIELLELVSTAKGVSVSSYLRKALKETLLEDFLSLQGHHSSFRTKEQISVAKQMIKERANNLN